MKEKNQTRGKKDPVREAQYAKKPSAQLVLTIMRFRKANPMLTTEDAIRNTSEYSDLVRAAWTEAGKLL